MMTFACIQLIKDLVAETSCNSHLLLPATLPLKILLSLLHLNYSHTVSQVIYTCTLTHTCMHADYVLVMNGYQRAAQASCTKCMMLEYSLPHFQDSDKTFHAATAVNPATIMAINLSSAVTLFWDFEGPVVSLPQCGTQQTVMRVTPPLHPRELQWCLD